jgi:hypothetical protein
MTTKDEKNPMVMIELDRPRFLRYGHKALKKLGLMTGKQLVQMDENEFDLTEIEKVMFCGLEEDALEHGEDLKLEDMESILDKAKSYGDIMESMKKALEMAFQPTEKQKN